MVQQGRRMNRVFLDTAYAIDLSSKDDAHHHRAVGLAQLLESYAIQLITTRAVMTEIGNALAKQRYRWAGIRLLQSMEQDPQVTIIPVTEELYARAFELYRQRPDKEWGLTDCISFIVMNDQQLTDALTTDVHFQQAGFRPLMRETAS
jgi:uncharacterized protein